MNQMDLLQRAFKANGVQCDTLYKAMTSNDLSDVVFAAHDIMKQIGFYFTIDRNKNKKCEWTSNKLRQEGNAAYCANNFQQALLFYNKALAYAPEGSRAMKLIYSNRSALLLKNYNYIACLNDIEKCFAMGCPDDIKNKMVNRKTEVLQLIWVEKHVLASTLPFIRDFFNIKGKENRDIPCATTDIGIIEEGQEKRVVAVKDIKVGTVLANEHAFTIMLTDTFQYFGCYYCCKLSMNLMPCPGCCHVLYCSEHCKNLSMAEGHNIECQIMDIIAHMEAHKVHFAFKTALKIKTMCHSWKELIDASNRLGVDRIQTSTVKEIYDCKEKFSLLNVESESLFVYGELYLDSFCLAAIAHYLRDVPSYLPADPEESHNALCALLRIAMYLCLHVPPLVVIPCAGSVIQQKTRQHEIHLGSYSFIGKLKHSCHPNCLEVCLNNRLALIAIKPIQSGTELTISKIGQNATHHHTKMSVMFKLYQMVCSCVCTKYDELTMDQKRMMVSLKANLTVDTLKTEETYRKVVNAMTVLSNVPRSEEHRSLYNLFKNYILRAQDVATRNVVIDFDYFNNKDE